ncbi:mitochondrial acidic protein MAM33-like [Bidens hawaiensis]|uniref:mitochondrial acidic protein MAM33-like n=1 Tax=Bidens hawaiensis TaxID=980011 RepID=UPI004049A76E
MSKIATLLQKGKKALGDLELLKILQSEIQYELSNDLYKNEIGSLGDFVIDWNSPHSKDIVMRKRCESGEEIAVSALLGEGTFVEDNMYPKEADMKVCIKKNGLRSILQFDCKVLDEGQNNIDFHIQNAYYLKSPTDFGSSVYKGPIFSDLDPALQKELKQYLISRGIRNNLTAYILHHIHHKEQDQYIKWLQKLEAMVALS